MTKKTNFNDPMFREEDDRLEAQLELWREKKHDPKTH